jgi:hypothetical protein
MTRGGSRPQQRPRRRSRVELPAPTHRTALVRRRCGAAGWLPPTDATALLPGPSDWLPPRRAPAAHGHIRSAGKRPRRWQPSGGDHEQRATHDPGPHQPQGKPLAGHEQTSWMTCWSNSGAARIMRMPSANRSHGPQMSMRHRFSHLLPLSSASVMDASTRPCGARCARSRPSLSLSLIRGRGFPSASDPDHDHPDRGRAAVHQEAGALRADRWPLQASGPVGGAGQGAHLGRPFGCGQRR